MQIGLYFAIPYAAATVTMIALARRSDRHGKRRRYVAWLVFASALALAAAAHVIGSLWAGLLSISLATCFLWSALSIFWAIPAEFLKGTAAAGGIAFINSIGPLGGFVSPSIIGYVKASTGSVQGGLWAMAAILLFGALLLAGSRPSRAVSRRSSEN